MALAQRMPGAAQWDNTDRQCHPANHSSLSKETREVASLVPTQKSLPPATPGTSQMPGMQGKATPLSSQEARGPRYPVQMLWHDPLPLPSSLRGELPVTEVQGWLRKWVIILALPDAIPWLQCPTGASPRGVLRSGMMAPGAHPMPLPPARVHQRFQSQSQE